MKNNKYMVQEKGRISVSQATLLLIVSVIASCDVFVPSFISQVCEKDCWIAVIIGTISAVIMSTIFINLGLRYPNKTIIQFSCDILGNIFGKVLGFLYIYYFIGISYRVVRELSEIFVISFNPESKIITYATLLIILAAYSLSKGLEVIARLNEFFVPIGIFILIFIGVINIKNMDLTNFLPIFYNGIKPPLKGSFIIQGWLLETFVVLQLTPFIKEKEKLKKNVYISILILGIILLFVFSPMLYLVHLQAGCCFLDLSS